MKKPRVYVDTSVIGGCLDPEFSLFNAVGSEMGYRPIQILSPREVTFHDV